MNKHEVGQKVWDTHNNCVWMLKSSEEKYGTTMWHVEENDYEWREDWFADIPKYVQELIDKCEATEKELEELKEKQGLIQDIEYLQGIVDTIIEYSIEQPRRVYEIRKTIKEYKDKLSRTGNE